MMEQHQKTVLDTSLAAAATGTVVIPCASADTMIIAWTMTNATAVGNLGATSVQMFAPGAATPLPNVLPAEWTVAAAFSSPVVSKIEKYDVRGLNTVRLNITNAAGGARTTEVHVYTQSSTG